MSFTQDFWKKVNTVEDTLRMRKKPEPKPFTLTTAEMKKTSAQAVMAAMNRSDRWAWGEALLANDTAKMAEIEAKYAKQGTAAVEAAIKKGEEEREAARSKSKEETPERQLKPWYAENTTWSLILLPAVILFLLLLAFGMGALRATATAITIPLLVYNVLAYSHYYLKENIDNKWVRAKTMLVPIVLVFIAIAFAESKDVSSQWSLFIWGLILFVYWWGFKAWQLKAEISLAMLTVLLLILWDKSAVDGNIAMYEEILHDGAMTFNKANAFLKAEAWILGFFNVGLKAALHLKLVFVGITMMLIQKAFMKEYMNMKYYEQTL